MVIQEIIAAINLTAYNAVQIINHRTTQTHETFYQNVHYVLVIILPTIKAVQFIQSYNIVTDNSRYKVSNVQTSHPIIDTSSNQQLALD